MDSSIPPSPARAFLNFNFKSGYKCVAQAVIDGVSYAVKEGIGWNEIKSVWNGAKTAGKSLARIASGLFG